MRMLFWVSESVALETVKEDSDTTNGILVVVVAVRVAEKEEEEDEHRTRRSNGSNTMTMNQNLFNKRERCKLLDVVVFATKQQTLPRMFCLQLDNFFTCRFRCA